MTRTDERACRDISPVSHWQSTMRMPRPSDLPPLVGNVNSGRAVLVIVARFVTNAFYIDWTCATQCFRKQIASTCASCYRFGQCAVEVSFDEEDHRENST